MKKNKGLIINGGNLTAQNLIVGDNTHIEYSINNSLKECSDETSDKNEDLLYGEIREIIAKNKLKQAIELMMEIFQSQNEVLNLIVLNSASLHRVEDKENSRLITNGEATIERNNIANALLNILETNKK